MILRLQRVLAAAVLVVPLAVLPVLAGLLFAHDATWSLVAGIGLGIVGGLLAVSALSDATRRNTLLAAAGTLLIAISTDAAVGGFWLTTFGREAVATVTATHHHAPARGSVEGTDSAELRLPDGDTVAGELRNLRPGAFHPGDRVRVRYDPTGVIRLPQFADSGKPLHDAVGGPVFFLVGYGLWVTARVRRGSGPAPTTRSDGSPGGPSISVDELQHRLAAEAGGGTDPPAPPPPAGSPGAGAGTHPA